MTQYPRDEFDQVPESAARQGVHRERFAPARSSGLALKIIAGLLVLLLGMAAYFLFPRLGIGQASQVAAETSSAAPMPSITAEDAPSEASSEEPSPSAAPTATPVPAEAPSAEPDAEKTEPAAVVDPTHPVAVLNATTVSGLASTAAGRLQSNGWNVVQIGNWSGQQLQGSIVLYNREDQRATADALAEALGIPTVQGNAAFSPNITVVVGPGFQ